MRLDELLQPLVSRLSRLTVGVVCASADGRTVYANPRIEHMVGPVPPGVPGDQWAGRFGLARPDGGAYRSPGEIPLLRALDEGDGSGLMVSRDRDGATLLQATALPVLDRSGSCVGSIGVFQPHGSSQYRPEERRPLVPRVARQPMRETDLIVLLLAALDLSDRVRGRVDEPVSERALRLVHERYAEDWTLSRLAEELCVSPGHLTSTVATQTGSGGLMHHLALVRVEEAKHLLASTDMPVVAIGHRVGLHDRQRFVRTFRRHTGSTPSAYRAAVRRNAPGPT